MTQRSLTLFRAVACLQVGEAVNFELKYDQKRCSMLTKTGVITPPKKAASSVGALVIPSSYRSLPFPRKQSAGAGESAGLWRQLWLAAPLSCSVFLSVLLHGVLLLVRFIAPELPHHVATDPQMEVVLLNARSEFQPVNPEVVAQTHLQGGGKHDTGRATSPMVAAPLPQDSPDIQRQSKHLEAFELQQTRLLALMSKLRSADVSVKGASAGRDNGKEYQEKTREIRRLQAQVDKQISDYYRRPKRLTYGVNAVGASYARYVEKWAARVEKFGTENFPAEAKGRYYDSMVVTVELNTKGEVVNVIMNQRSKHEVLNQSVHDIVYGAAPYGRFSSEMASQGDILQIVRVWHFSKGAIRTSVADQ